MDFHEQVKTKKQARMNLMLLRARKLGQLRAFDQMGYLLGQEIKKEEKELLIIEEDLGNINREIKAIT